MNKEVLKTALTHLEDPAVSFQISASVDRPGWRLVVKNVEICVLSESEKNAIMAPLVGYQKAELDTKKAMTVQTLQNVRSFINRLLEQISSTSIRESNALDCLVAEKIMGWNLLPDYFSCGCACYVSSIGEKHFVSRMAGRPCIVHQNWAPSTNLQDVQSFLMEKLFSDAKGNQFAITNVNSNYHRDRGVRTVVTFRNAARSENSVETADEQLMPPAAVCLIALRKAGVDIQI